MRERLISFLKSHPRLVSFVWSAARCFLQLCSLFLPVKKTILFSAFGGRRFDDSPKALYDEICRRKEFDDWQLVWAFVEPEKFQLPRGTKVKIDTPRFFYTLLTSRIWIGNSEVDRGIGLSGKKHIRVETWHGTPLKKICGEENQNSFGKDPAKYTGKIDRETIRCAQSEYDREIFARIFHASKDSILLSDLPRNDSLLKYSQEEVSTIRKSLGIPTEKKVILYTPTYREYLVNENHQTYIAPPIDLARWKEELGSEYMLLVRAHYAVSASMGLKDDDFVKDVSNYPCLNDLYVISDMMISDYSSTYFDYAILDRLMFCFAYDRAEYEQKRGLYLNLDDVLPCSVDMDEETLLAHIKNADYKEACEKTKCFHEKFAPYSGNASFVVVNKILEKLGC